MNTRKSDPNGARKQRRQYDLTMESICQKLEERLLAIAEYLKNKPAAEATVEDAALLSKILHGLEETRMGIRWQKKLEQAILLNPSLLARMPGPFPMARKVGSMAAQCLKALSGDQRRTAARNRKHAEDAARQAELARLRGIPTEPPVGRTPPSELPDLGA